MAKVKTTTKRPLILFTNDDGIASPGLWAVAGVFAEVGDILIVAPRQQQSGMGRSLPSTSEGRIYPYELPQNGKSYPYTAFAVDGTPAQAVQHGVLELADRLPSLVVSGINYGENVGNGVTISGTVGAALEAASIGIPAIAISQQMNQDLHLSYSTDVDFSAGAGFALQFGKWLIDHAQRPDDVDVLKIEIPADATPNTAWRTTRLSRRRVFWPTRPEREALSDVGKLGYHFDADPSQAEPDSDVYAVLHERIVAVTPLSLDLTSRTDLFRLRQILNNELKYSHAPRMKPSG